MEAINKQEKQSKIIKTQETEKKEKSKNIVLLKYTLDDILLIFCRNISPKGKDILKKLPDDEKKIDNNNLFFKTGDPIIKNFDILKRFGTLYYLLIGLLNTKISIKKEAEEQNEMIKKINELADFVLAKDIKAEKSSGAIKKTKAKTQRKQIFEANKSIIKNALMLYDNITTMTNAFVMMSILKI